MSDIVIICSMPRLDFPNLNSKTKINSEIENNFFHKKSKQICKLKAKNKLNRPDVHTALEWFATCIILFLCIYSHLDWLWVKNNSILTFLQQRHGHPSPYWPFLAFASMYFWPALSWTQFSCLWNRPGNEPSPFFNCGGCDSKVCTGLP